MLDKKDGRHQVTEISSLALPRDRMGFESLSLLLAPPEEIMEIRFQGPWVDIESSHLIEVERCYIKNGIIRPGRFWYVPKTYVDRVCVDKPEEFLNWAQTVYRKTKSLLSKHSHGDSLQFQDWFGNVAWQEVSASKLSASAN